MQSDETSSLNSAFATVNFEVDVNEATQLLGVSRTRLSQLVSKGVLGFERRRVDTRMRMYFNRTELLGYLRRQMSGASAKVKQNEWIFDAEPVSQGSHDFSYASTDQSDDSKPTSRMFVSVMRHGASPNQARGAHPHKASALAMRRLDVQARAAASAQAQLRRDVLNEARRLEKKFHQLQNLNVTSKPNLISARLAATEKKEDAIEITRTRQPIRTLSKSKSQRVAIR